MWTKPLNNICNGAHIKSVTPLIVNYFKCNLTFPENNNLFIVNSKPLQQGVKYAQSYSHFVLMFFVADLEQRYVCWDWGFTNEYFHKLFSKVWPTLKILILSTTSEATFTY